MKDRLDKFIKTEGLTPSRFAEIMGVQPSSISHILGGRNKPNYDFIEKILMRFPKLNPDWLILGKGNIYRSLPGDLRINDSQGVQPGREDLFTLQETSPADTYSSDTVISEDRISNAENRTTNETARTSRQQSIPKSDLSKNPVNDNDIEKIVIFFKDKSFVSFDPK